MTTDGSGARVGRITTRPELVFGLVGALGTDLKRVQEEIQAALRTVAYDSSIVRLSDLISDVYRAAGEEEAAAEPYMAQLMSQGDSLRSAAGLDAAAVLGISRIWSERKKLVGDDSERQSHATILRSLKRPEEVTKLRQVYGSRFVLIGAWSTRQERSEKIDRDLRSRHPGQNTGWYAQQTAVLIERDEKDEREPLGQRVRDTFELADVYVAVHPGANLTPALSRLIKLLFGAPFVTPTRHEEAMFMASGAGLRSSAAGRQVGAVVIDKDGEILVTGTNEAPKAHLTGGMVLVGTVGCGDQGAGIDDQHLVAPETLGQHLVGFGR